MIYNSTRFHTSKLKRVSVLNPNLSPWAHLFSNGDASSFVEMLGMDRQTFLVLTALIYPNDQELPKTASHRSSLCNNYVKNS